VIGNRIDYSYINARLHALISRLLSPQQLSALHKAQTIPELLHQLRETPYADLADIYSRTGDTHMVELELVLHQKQMYANLLKHSPESLHTMIRAFSFDVDVFLLTSAVRLWFDQALRGRPIGKYISYIPKSISYHGVTLHQIINTPDLKKLIDMLKNAGFIGSGAREIPRLEHELLLLTQSRHLFYVELAVDAAYYIHLRSAEDTLGRTDRTIIEHLITREIDLKNIGRIIRHPEAVSRLTREVDPSDMPYELSRFLIPGGADTDIQKVNSAVTEFKAESSSQKRSLDEARKETAVLLERLGVLIDSSMQETASVARHERMLRELDGMQERLSRELERQVTRYKRSDPFTIGTLTAFLLLKKRDIDQVRSLMHAAYYGLSGKEVSRS
jgi:vacuolar-type H+-ATPase subunit C/Vma6